MPSTSTRRFDACLHMTATAAVLATLSVWPGVANTVMAAGSTGHRQPSSGAQLGYYGDQRGCYWADGRRSCARYCYWEFDRVRYCRAHKRSAHPQGDPWYSHFPPEPPIYPPYRRPR